MYQGKCATDFASCKEAPSRHLQGHEMHRISAPLLYVQKLLFEDLWQNRAHFREQLALRKQSLRAQALGQLPGLKANAALTSLNLGKVLYFYKCYVLAVKTE